MCPCGGLLDKQDLTQNRYRWWCQSCGRYEIFRYPDKRNDLFDAEPE